jgi:hypothetical protein
MSRSIRLVVLAALALLAVAPAMAAAQSAPPPLNDTGQFLLSSPNPWASTCTSATSGGSATFSYSERRSFQQPWGDGQLDFTARVSFLPGGDRLGEASGTFAFHSDNGGVVQGTFGSPNHAPILMDWYAYTPPICDGTNVQFEASSNFSMMYTGPGLTYSDAGEIYLARHGGVLRVDFNAYCQDPAYQAECEDYAPPAPPAPTTKAECAKDGWKAFPGFKNQGECVSFAATGGSKQPAGS